MFLSTYYHPSPNSSICRVNLLSLFSHKKYIFVLLPFMFLCAVMIIQPCLIVWSNPFSPLPASSFCFIYWYSFHSTYVFIRHWMNFLLPHPNEVNSPTQSSGLWFFPFWRMQSSEWLPHKNRLHPCVHIWGLRIWWPGIPSGGHCPA